MRYEELKNMSHGGRMLWAAVLRRAVFDYVLYKGSRRHSIEWKRAFQYIFVEGHRRDEGLSFSDVCDLFGWDSGYLQRLTVKLARSDIKKMEVTQLREDFVFDAAEVVVSQTEKWKTSNFAAPFLPLYRYSVEYRRRFQPRLIRKETFISSTMPVIRWQASM